LPLKLSATVQAKDPENDPLTYTWKLGNGTTQETSVPRLEYTLNTAGDYKISVDVKDDEGASSTSEAVSVYAGNEAPVVNIEVTGGNRSFFLEGEPLKYRILVSDKDDTSEVDPDNLFVSVDYAEGGYDKAEATMGHQQGEVNIIGKGLVASLDCKSCHKESEKSIGPSYTQISQKYGKNPDALNYLTGKIQKGSQGVWGETQMPAHPTLPENDIHQIVNWILSITSEAKAQKSLPISGTITPPSDLKPNTSMVISATYTDKGGNNIKALTSSNSLVLPGSFFSFKGKEKAKGFKGFKFNNRNVLVIPEGGGWFALDSIDLTGVASADIFVGWQNPPSVRFDFEARLDAPAGQLLGKGKMAAPRGDEKTAIAHVPFHDVTDGKYHSIYIIYVPGKTSSETPAGIAGVKFNGR
jgi:cytochrome c551/c552